MTHEVNHRFLFNNAIQSRLRKLRVSFVWAFVRDVMPDLRRVWSGEPTNGRIAYCLRGITTEHHNTGPESAALGKPEQVFRVWSWCWKEKSYLSYADEVRKEMTKPNTVPSTVNSWFEKLKLTEVNWLTQDTTTERC